MDIQNEKNKLKKQNRSYKKHPMINLADSINRSTIWDLNRLTKEVILPGYFYTYNHLRTFCFFRIFK